MNTIPVRLAVIDVGTNTIRCVAVEARGSGDFTFLADERAAVRLGEGLRGSGKISPAAWERSRDALSRMAGLLDRLGIRRVEAVATSAVRKAANGREFVGAMKEDTGLSVRVIGAEEEASLAARSARRRFDLSAVPHGVVDIGGGSVEVVLGGEGRRDVTASLELGAVYLTEEFLARGPLEGSDCAGLLGHIRRCLHDEFDGKGFSLREMIGSGGTFKTIGSMVAASPSGRRGPLHGFELRRGEVADLFDVLRRRSGDEREPLPGLSAERADIIAAGTAVAGELMEFFGVETVKVNEWGIREGLILKCLEEISRPGHS
jgi:exopolyphosphatase/guanosine-5'-triphosphate,3'-diphosphate pyrophosphatase